VRAEPLQRRTPAFCEHLVAAGPIARTTEKILLGLPSHLLRQPQKPLSLLCGTSAAAGIALGALPSRIRWHGTSAVLSTDASSLLPADTPRRSTARAGALAGKDGRNPSADTDEIAPNAAVEAAETISVDFYGILEDLLKGPWEMQAP